MSSRIDHPQLLKVISGGQTGADIAALRAAKSLGFQTGGHIPRGFKTLAGPKPEYADLYGLKEMPTASYRERTYENVRDSDATLRIAHNFSSPGERCTFKAILKYDRPHYDVDVWINQDEGAYGFGDRPQHVADWITRKKIQVLNVAGNSGEWYEYIVEAFFVSVLKTVKRHGLRAA